MSANHPAAVQDGDSNPSLHDSNVSPQPENEKQIREGSDHVNADNLDMDHTEYRHIIHKLDWAIIPYCSLLYLLSFLDRVNIGQAAVAGLKGDLDMVKGNAYAISLSVFFIGYIIVEVPSNLVLKALKPHRWIPLM